MFGLILEEHLISCGLKNTTKKYNASKVMVDLRVNQFMKMINKDKKYFKIKIFRCGLWTRKIYGVSTDLIQKK